uniref:Uncharacterized protein n=1 Tax=Chromera velia CCMP2878 TaxID=1169474 RepID=A0A0G4IEA7_9ALVE|eukprot:Cvel_13656.t1-p1 / transcript=Cvel_13656.t1 / gene=Cvel_13656 / organism=Chromera_velia_CCMP2878 / gene_product=hypothetical protein / transcript_product=hypothetical protein / location=Cvel_scaffold942:19641-23783(-) / protein_length=938 / sequence_SO=supercontig / SO=protein_coding / is_pseudo=false
MTPAKDSDVTSALIASGFLGLRHFWKLSSLSKKLLRCRDDTTTLGIGSVSSGFCSVSEREELWKLIDSCCQQDDARALRQVFSLRGVSGRYPFLLRRILEKNPSSTKCVQFLIELEKERKETSFPSELSDTLISGLTPERFIQLIEVGILHPNSWWETGDRSGPLINRFINLNRFDLAECVLLKGGRVDVCDWEMRNASGASRNAPMCGSTPLQLLVQRLAVGPKTGENRQKGISLLRLIAEASKESGCFDWKARDIPNALTAQEPLSALQLACLRQDAEVVRVLVQVKKSEGENCQETCRGLALLVFVASVNGNGGGGGPAEIDTACADTLNELADLRSVDLNAVNSQRHTPLTLACSLRLNKTAETLLQRGAVPKRVKGYRTQSRPPLREALVSKSASLVSVLMRWKCDPNEVVVPSCRGGGYTALEVVLSDQFPRVSFSGMCTTDGGIPMLKMLLEAGAGLGVAEKDGHSILSFAYSEGCPSAKVMQFLRERGLPVGGGGKGKEGPSRVPLVEAACRADCASMELLLQWGADVNEVQVTPQPKSQSKEQTLAPKETSPLDVVIGRLRRSAEIFDSERRRDFSLIHLLIDRGAHCSPESSSFLFTEFCERGDASLLILLCEKGLGVPNGWKGIAAVVATLLSDRENCSKKTFPKDGILQQWRLADSLLQTVESRGETKPLFQHVSSLLKKSGCRRLFAARAGSGCWIADLISLQEARGTLLAEIIERVEFDTQVIATSTLKSEIRASDHFALYNRVGFSSHEDEPRHYLPSGVRREGEYSPLIVAVKAGWKEGVQALLGTNANVNEWGRCSHGPLCAALEMKEWQLAELLCDHEGWLIREEERLLRSWAEIPLALREKIKILPTRAEANELSLLSLSAPRSARSDSTDRPSRTSSAKVGRLSGPSTSFFPTNPFAKVGWLSRPSTSSFPPNPFGRF